MVLQHITSVLVTAGKGGFAPCTAKACMAILNHYNIPLEGKHVVVVGRSQVIGKPVALMAPRCTWYCYNVPF